MQINRRFSSTNNRHSAASWKCDLLAKTRRGAHPLGASVVPFPPVIAVACYFDDRMSMPMRNQRVEERATEGGTTYAFKFAYMTKQFHKLAMKNKICRSDAVTFYWSEFSCFF